MLNAPAGCYNADFSNTCVESSWVNADTEQKYKYLSMEDEVNPMHACHRICTQTQLTCRTPHHLVSLRRRVALHAESHWPSSVSWSSPSNPKPSQQHKASHTNSCIAHGLQFFMMRGREPESIPKATKYSHKEHANGGMVPTTAVAVQKIPSCSNQVICKESITV